MNPKIILAVAPTGGWGRGNDNPITPDAIARDVIACAQAGAAVVHMHARNEKGELTTDLAPFSRAVAAIKASCDIVLEASTGGLSNLTAAERVLPASSDDAEMGSLNIGSLNFEDAVYQNSLPDVRLWIETMVRSGVKPSLEIFDTGHLETAPPLDRGRAGGAARQLQYYFQRPLGHALRSGAPCVPEITPASRKSLGGDFYPQS